MADPTITQILAKAGILATSDCYYVQIQSMCNDHPTFRLTMRDINGNLYSFLCEQVFSHDQAEKLAKACADVGQPMTIIDLEKLASKFERN